MMRPVRSILLLVGFLLALTVQAQEQPVRTIAFEDPEVFCHILHNNKKQRLTAITTFDELAKNPADTILIIFGNPRFLNVQEALRQIRGFQANGGALLLATDKPFRHPELPIHISGSPIHRFPGFEGEWRCPWLAVAAENPRETWDRKHPIFQMVLKGIATNCPSHVRIESNDKSVGRLLSFPVDAKWDWQGNRPPEDYIVGSASDSPASSGRALFVAGHGVFMNGMLMQSKTDNFTFAVNVVEWLAEGPNGKRRSKAMLIVDGTIVSDFDMKLTPPAPPIPMPPRAIINRLLRDMQEEGLFHHFFHEFVDVERAAALVLSLMVGMLLVYGAKKVLEGRQQVDSTAPRMVGAKANLAPTPNALKAQQAASLNNADLGREAKTIAREWLEMAFGVEPDRWTTDLSAQLQVQRTIWQGGATQSQADLILRCARNAKQVRVSQREFLQLTRALRDLNAALQDGRVTLLIDGKNVRKTA